MAATPVPLVDLAWQAHEVAKEVATGFDEVVEQTAFILGPQVAAFEHAYADYCGARHCVGVGNGTDALELALRASEVGRGDEVVLPANTFVATVEAVLRAGAVPVLADCDPYLLLDPGSVAERTSRRTRAVVGVHLYGQMAPLGQLRAVVAGDVRLVEDAAQSQGARQAGRRSGAAGDVAATSFYPGKNLGAYGDAGGVTTDDDQVAAELRALRNHGGTQKYEHRVLGTNSRLDTLQAVVLLAKLDRLDEWNGLRQVAARRYHAMLADLPAVATPQVAPGNEHVWHLYVVRVPDRDRVLAELAADGIGAGIHYPLPIHQLPAFHHLGRPGEFPEAEQASREILSLPLFPGITVEQQERVVASLRAALLC